MSLHTGDMFPLRSESWESSKVQASLMNQYFNHRWRRNVTTIGIGELFVTDQDMLVGTVLGSCISVVLWDPQKRIGGINHYISPEPPYRGEDSADRLRYGTVATPALLERMLESGASRAALRAKVFGGACIRFCSDDGEAEPINATSVGPLNSRLALEYLKNQSIPVDQFIVGGSRGRIIYLDIRDFTVYLKGIDNSIGQSQRCE